MKQKILDKSLAFLETWLAAYFSHVDIPGVAISINYKNESVFNQAYGFARLEPAEKLTPKHLFRIASHSKTFTAVALFQLIEAGRLKLTDRASKYLPWLKENADPRVAKITIKQLMSHSSGIIRDADDRLYWTFLRPFPNESEIKQTVIGWKQSFDPGTLMKYSNTGFCLLGMIVREASGETFESFVTENVIKPLGLRNTSCDYPPPVGKKLAIGYSRRELGQRVPIDTAIKVGSASPAAGFYSNGEDLCKFYSALRRGTGLLISDESKRMMEKSRFSARWHNEEREYGLGLEIGHYNGNRVIGHGGSFPGFRTCTNFDYKNDLTVSVLNTTQHSDARIMSYGIRSVFDFFADNYKSGAKLNSDKIEGRYADLYSMAQIVVWGDKTFVCYPEGQYPFAYVERMNLVAPNEYRTEEANAYCGLHERVTFKLNERNEIEHMMHTGDKLVPEQEYLKRFAQLIEKGEIRMPIEIQVSS